MTFLKILLYCISLSLFWSAYQILADASFSSTLTSDSLTSALRQIHLEIEKSFTHASFRDLAETLPNVQLFQWNYQTHLSALNHLVSAFPNLMKLEFAEEIWNDVQEVYRPLYCDQHLRCKIPIVKLTNFKRFTPQTPQLFISGTLHGNERVGPDVVLNLIMILLSGYEKDERIQYLLDKRLFYIMPFPNAYGYSSNQRREKYIDPNRDFPYPGRNDACLQTEAARAVYHAFQDHLFQAGITLHGGVRALGFPWGIPSECKYSDGECSSTEAPDYQGANTVSTLLQSAAGRESQTWFYSDGPINDGVYPVYGAMSDWAYSNSWYKLDTPSSCHPNLSTSSNSDSNRCLMYLVETYEDKNPNADMYGWVKELFEKSDNDGIISRNIRLILKLAEMIEPELKLDTNHLLTAPGQSLLIRFVGLGCNHISSWHTKLYGVDCKSKIDTSKPLIEYTHAIHSPGMDCTPRGLWESTEIVEDTDYHEISIPATELFHSKGCLTISTEFDQDWGVQVDPSPNVPPQSHAVRARLENYVATDPNHLYKIEGRKTRVYEIDVYPN